MFEKHPQHYNFIDSDARNAFSQGLTAAALKCSSGFNMHGTRDCVINKNVIDWSWPRCRETECWDHVLNWRYAERKRDDYLNKLTIKIMKADDKNEDSSKIKK